MEPEIKHVAFSNGQFLTEDEFNLEQLYHIHMRRRVNWSLFEKTGVVEGLDLVPNPATMEVTVQPGMAVRLVPDSREGVELVLRQPATLDLDPLSLGAGEQAFLTLRYERQVAGDRIEERAVLGSAKNAPAVATPPVATDPVVIGVFDDALAEQDGREQALLRAALLAAAPSPSPTASITGISPAAGNTGTSVSVTITGTGLAGATDVVFSGTGITVSNVTAVGDTQVTADLQIDPGAAGGVRSFTVVTPQGPVQSGAVSFSVNAPAAVLVTSVTAVGNPGAVVTVQGQNLHTPGLADGQDVTTGPDPTQARLLLPDNVNPSVPDEAQVFFVATDVMVEAVPPGSQALGVRLPEASDVGVPSGPVQVFVQVEHGGAKGSSPNKLTILF